MADSRLVLITGGSGYVGSILVPKVAALYPVRTYDSQLFGNPNEGIPDVEIVTGDMRDLESRTEIFDGVTDIIHLAGIVTDELVAMNPTLAYEVNEAGTQTLCRLAVKAGVTRMIYASSSGVYGNTDNPATEDTPIPVDHPSIYMRTKHAGEIATRQYFSAPGLTTVSVRSATCCGPAPRIRLDTIVNVFSKQAYYDGRITVHGGSQMRTNIHVEDVTDLYALLLDADRDKIHQQAFNATAGNHDALTLAKTVASVITRNESGGPIHLDVDKTKQDSRSYWMSGLKVWADLGWQPKRTIREAVADNLAWFKAGKLGADPDDPIFSNTQRMEGMVKGAT